MLTLIPTYRLKGTPDAKHHRILIDAKKRKANAERFNTIKKLLPRHYIRTGNRDYISAEAWSAPIHEIESFRDQHRFITAQEQKRILANEMIANLTKVVDKLLE